MEYLGYIVSEKGIAADPRKVEAVQTFPVPNNLKCLRSFLGLASYYRRFIQNFSVIANPLYALTRKDAVFDWSPACQEAFDRLKMVLTNAPLLAFPDFNRDFLLETDASGIGLGAVLAQKQAEGRYDQSPLPVEHSRSTRKITELQRWKRWESCGP